MSIPRMNYPQYRKARKLTHECCNYCDGNCLLLDDGEECVCAQSISYLLLCRWFRAAVLPLDGALYAEIIQSRDNVKRCTVCGAAFTPKSNRAKYCPDCAVRMRRKQEPKGNGKDTCNLYAVRSLKSPVFRSFLSIAAGVVGRFIIYPPKRCSKCVEIGKK